MISEKGSCEKSGFYVSDMSYYRESECIIVHPCQDECRSVVRCFLTK